MELRMNVKKIMKNMFIVSVFISLLAVSTRAAAAESSSEITCESRLLFNGSVHFQLSQGPSSSSCKTCWEDGNKTVIARDKDFLASVVQSLRSDSITLVDCRPLLYSRECSGVLQEIHCPVNCSHHVDPDPPSNPSNLSNSISPDKLIIIIIIIIIIAAAVAVALLIVVVLWCRRKKKCSSYSQTPQTV